MNILPTYNIIAVILGIIFLAASFLHLKHTDQYIPKSILSFWFIMEVMILFFLGGYLLFLVIITQQITFPVNLVTSTVFLAGSMFVLLMINVTKITIKRIKEREMELREIHKQLNQAYESTIEGWGLALELRDEETEGHTKRVTELTLRLSRQYGVPEEDLVHIRRGALLHDIGKIAVSDRILMKTDALSPEEKQEMRNHPEYARRMLANISYLREAMVIPYCHHERWDGSGYPQGLKGEDIPLAARLFAVADVWDALIYKRRYHKAWSQKRVCDHIKSRSGSHFDPKVVDCFMELALCDETREISRLEP